MTKNFTLQLPTSGRQLQEITTSRSLLFIGANGSGKTRLGTWIEIESPQRHKVHRISAQKSLAMPDNVAPMPTKTAKNILLCGYSAYPVEETLIHKLNGRWNQKPAITPLDDYSALLIYLISDHIEESMRYLQSSKESANKIEPPNTKLEQVKEIWEKILPHRKLTICEFGIKTQAKGGPGETYSSSEMSDGERVIFYLIGQCLAAPDGAILVIDEPELHIHKSIQTPLWREIESLRTDCLFVYMTHDVDFAANLTQSCKIWLKAYNGSEWEWEQLEDIDTLPEALLIEVVGSRKPVLFVEGENGSPLNS